MSHFSKQWAWGQKERIIRRRWFRAWWFREWSYFQELNRLSCHLPSPHPWPHGDITWNSRYHRAREKRAWQEAL